MGKLLRYVSDRFHITIFTFLILAVVGDPLCAQVKLDNLQPFELEISGVSDLSDGNYWRLNPSESGIRSFFGIGELIPDEAGGGHFLAERPEGNYIALRPSERSGSQLMAFTISNASGRTINRMEVTVDLAFMSSGGNSPDVYLVYEFGSAAGTEHLLDSQQFTSDPETWQTVTVNAGMENLLLGPDESIRIVLEARETRTAEPTGAVALQRMEFNPEEFHYPDVLSVGDLVLTEIQPQASVMGESLGYLELYNSTFERVDLQGLKIRVGEEEHTIRKSIVMEPYRMAVVSSRDLPHPQFMPDVILEGLQIPSHGGMIELEQGGVSIIRSAYDEQVEMRSWELKSVLNVMDGYAAISDFEVSETRLSAETYGSPGSRGLTERAFSRNFHDTGNWIMVGVPGLLAGETRAANSYWTGKTAVQQGAAGQVRRGAGLLKSLLERDSEKLVAAESGEPAVELELPEEEGSWVLLGNPYETRMNLNRVEAVGGEFLDRTAQVWDSEAQSFRILEPNAEVEPWQAFIMKNGNAEAVRFRGEGVEGADETEVSGRNRSISFELRSTGSRQGNLADHAARLYFHESSSGGRDPLDAEKLWPVFQNGPSGRGSLLYFISRAEEKLLFLAQDSRPYEPEAPFEVTLGHIAYNVSGTHQLTWNDFHNIPEQWEIILTDLHTGITVNMREENQLVFEAAPGGEIRPEFSDTPMIYPLESPEPFERFALSVNPDPDLFQTKQVEDQDPDQVELYQNYPNPFSAVTTIDFFLPEETSVVVSVYNIVGQRVANLREGVRLEGGRRHEVEWDASEMPSGIYIVRLEIGNRVLTRKMTLVK